MNPFIQYRLENQHQELNFLVKGLDIQFLEKAHLPNKWSIKEHLAHLGRYQEIFQERINQILKKNTPKFERYKAEEDEFFKLWLELDMIEVHQKSKVFREDLTALLINLDKETIQRIGVHPKFGAMNIEVWAHFFLLHESHHIYSIFRLIQAFEKL